MKEEAKDDLDGPISTLNRKSFKKKDSTSIDKLKDDDSPLSSCKAKKKNPSNPSQTKKEELEEDEDDKPLKKMEGLKKRPSNPPKVEKEEEEDDEKPLKKKEVLKKRPSNPPKVEKEEDEDDEKPLKKKEVLKNISKPKNVKKGVVADSDEEEEDNKSKKRKRKEEKRTVMEVKKVVKIVKVVNDKKVKKVYELPGQKQDPPEMRDPLRIFYETLYEKVPTSEMAMIWLMERGLLSLEEAQKAYAKKLRKNHNQKFGSPAKTPTPMKKSSAISVKKVKVTSQTVVKTNKKKVNNSDDDDDDFVIKKLGNKKKASS